MWVKIKAFFKDSETIFLARFEAVSGFVIASLSLVDWSPLLTLFGAETGFTWKQTLSLGAIMFIKGIVGEVARRFRADDL